ncbi:MAG TPA: bifunctional diaminohydroxyphosphoribosylaminopyrimidine deaminase/5-amino-6-(5-phosphoribosylamino)uracil reductase RibD [Flavobacterium sp.]|nr:bifunctional diaminohydroxyphosphoribosylaminopyrimidine deaminase/5-amino-6-(5-phosphoribosylamino)uracil reductase RibD [Flavobacterium sp.]
MKVHEKYIRRCIELARHGLGTTYPNPLVGAVIVHNNRIIGEGWHRKAGEPHAEVLAVRSVRDASLLKEATLYVSLEPCSHFGRTPPCCDLILEHDIPHIVIGTTDTFSKVAGEGIRRLREAGRNVTLGILEAECRDLNRRFFTFHEQKRPYIILKWAQSADGFLAPLQRNERRPVWITQQTTRQLVHKWRTEEPAILVGTQTAIDDNPKLDARLWSGAPPLRFVFDRNGRLPAESVLLQDGQPTIVLTQQKRDTNGAVEYEAVPFDDPVREFLEVAYKRDVQSVVVEGGRTTLQSFIDARLWDEARVITGRVSFGEGLPAPILPFATYEQFQIKHDTIRLYRR